MQDERPSPPGFRLLMLVPFFEMGGANKFDLDLMDQLGGRGWEMACAGMLKSNDTWLEEYRARSSAIYHLARSGAPGDLAFALNRIVAGFRPDIILITQNEPAYWLLPLLRGAAPRAAIVDYCHMEESWSDGGYPRLSVDFERFLDLSIVSSQHLKNWMVERGLPEGRVEVCTTNIDSGRWFLDSNVRQRIRAAHGIADDAPVIVFSGRLCPQKQPRVLAGTLRELNRRGIRFHALIAGDGEDRPWLEDYLLSHNLKNRVHLLGAVPQSGMRETLAAGDLFFLPSQYEGIALSIYEAMAMGLMVVGADVGGQRELIVDGCGILLPRADEGGEIQAYADTLQDLILHPERRRAMAAQARSRIESKFSLTRMGEWIQELFVRVIEAARRRPADSQGERLARLAGEWLAARMADDSRLGGEEWLRWLASAEGEELFRTDGAMADYLNILLRRKMRELARRPSWRVYRTFREIKKGPLDENDGPALARVLLDFQTSLWLQGTDRIRRGLRH